MPLSKEAREFFVKEGRKGGKAYAKNASAEERTASARRAAEARWAKEKAELKEVVHEITAGTKALEKRAKQKKKPPAG